MTDEQKIAELQPEFRPIVKQILASLKVRGWQPKIAEGKRTVEQQREKVNKGYSKTMNSYHLTGYAVDIIDARYAWNIPRNHKFWYDLGSIVIEMGKKYPALGWGGLWSRGKLDTAKETERWAVYKEAVEKNQEWRIRWFADVAHVEMRY